MAKAKPEDLAGVKGIGGKKAEKLIEEAKRVKG
ncbi:helix-hairpin-helix domain-containing protein [Candidatus Omnitrophota bacterium]